LDTNEERPVAVTDMAVICKNFLREDMALQF
jgi:hypothetical protein